MPDGSRVTLDLVNTRAGGPWNCLFQTRVHRVLRAFTVCDRDASLCLARRMGEFEIHQYHDVELVTAYDSTLAESMAAWRGPWHSLVTDRTGPSPAVESNRRVFDAFALTDSREGLLMRPRSARELEFRSLFVFKEIPGLGDLRIERPHQGEVSIPSWRGAPARDGEIWRRYLNNGGDVPRARPNSLVLATSTAVAELIPGPDDTPDDGAAAEFLADLGVSWTTG